MVLLHMYMKSIIVSCCNFHYITIYHTYSNDMLHFYMYVPYALLFVIVIGNDRINIAIYVTGYKNHLNGTRTEIQIKTDDFLPTLLSRLGALQGL